MNVVISIQRILSFVLSRKIINIYSDIAQKYGNVTVKDFRKYEKLEYKKIKLNIDIDFLNNCKQLGVYPNFLIFKLLNVSNKDALSIVGTIITIGTIGTFNYNLACFLCDLHSPLVSNDYSCKDTFSFVSQIENANLSKKFLFSYNVTSLFTNTQLQETIYIAINLIFNHNSNPNITRKEHKKLFLFAASQTDFIFHSKFYNQIDGVAMGSPLAPVPAKIFMGFRKSKWLN